MYRIRLASGEEAVYRTAEELAKAVTSGVVSETAEVFHKSADRWLPINTHPDYRAVVTGKRPAAAPPAPSPVVEVGGSRAVVPVPAEPPVASSAISAPAEPIPVPPQAPSLPVAPVPATVALEPRPPAAPVGQASRESGRPSVVSSTRASRLRVMLALAMGLVAVGVLAGGAYLAWPKASSWLVSHRDRRATLSEGMSPDTVAATADSTGIPDTAASPGSAATRRLDSIPDLFPAPSRPLASAPTVADSTSEPASEETRVSRLTATRTRLPSYFEAYADARAEMDDGFDYVSFRRVFAPSRFAAPESVRATRRMVAAAGNILRVYRGREVMLEQTYRPDDPGGRGSLREPFETAEASRALLADVDSLFGILVSQQGRYTYSNEAIHFQDPRTARVYSQLRAEIVSTLASWRDSSGAQNRITLPRLLQALGGTAPPPIR